MIQISNRLTSVAGMVTPGHRLADIGTDHAYIPIHLVQNHSIPSAIAMDINPGPLSKAQKNIKFYQLQDHIETRLSDGVAALRDHEVDTIIIAGMGGGLVQKILTEGHLVLATVKEFILQPQSELSEVRHYLAKHNYNIIAENIVCEDGKYYPMMKAIKVTKGLLSNDREIYYRYGKHLLQQQHPILHEFLKKEYTATQNLSKQLSQAATPSAKQRVLELDQELILQEEALSFFA